MGTLSSELGPLVEHVADQPRVYADANLPNGTTSDEYHSFDNLSFSSYEVEQTSFHDKFPYALKNEKLKGSTFNQDGQPDPHQDEGHK